MKGKYLGKMEKKKSLISKSIMSLLFFQEVKKKKTYFILEEKKSFQSSIDIVNEKISDSRRLFFPGKKKQKWKSNLKRETNVNG